MDFTFEVVSQNRSVDVLAPELVELEERFDSAKGLTGYEEHTPSPEQRPARVDRRHGSLSLSGDAPFFHLFRSSTHLRAPFVTVTADVVSFAECDGEQDAVFVGLVKDERNYVAAWFSRTSEAAGVDAVVDGEVRTLGALPAPVVGPCRVAFSLTGNRVAALLDTGDGFRPAAHGDVPGELGLQQPDTLADYRNGFGARASSGTVVLDAVEGGYFGQVGLRDPRPVSYADGTPYVKYNKVYLTMTQAGLGFFETAHWGVWTLDLRNYELEQVGNLFFQRDGSDTVLGDHAGHLVRDERNGRWIVATSTWGDFTGDNVDVHYATVPTSTDLLHGVHVLTTERLDLPVAALPSEAVGQWSPHVVRIADRWFVGFVNARAFFDFYPVLACSEPGADFTELSLAGADAAKTATEGVVIQRVEDEWYVVASNGDASPPEVRARYPVYDLKMGEVGTLNAPHPSGIPWPTVFAVPDSRDRTRWLMVTFDDTLYHEDKLGFGTHGDLLVLEHRPRAGLVPKSRRQ